MVATQQTTANSRRLSSEMTVLTQRGTRKDVGFAVPEDVAKTINLFPLVVQEFLWPLADQIQEVFLQHYQPIYVEAGNRWFELPLETSHNYISKILARAGKPKANNRVGVDGTLSRISVIYGDQKDLNGLKIRFGRIVEGVADKLIPLILTSDDSILILGAPSAGKTTLLRGTVAPCAKRYGPGLVTIDTNGEITGAGARMHTSLGGFTRFMVPDPSVQPQLLREAIRNMSPKCIIMDELTSKEELASATEGHRKGVRIITTIHGGSWEKAFEFDLNREILGDIDMDKRKRRTSPVFESAVFVKARGVFEYYPNLTQAIDDKLAFKKVNPSKFPEEEDV